MQHHSERDGGYSDEFCMYSMKITLCSRHRGHDWSTCPYAHPGEKVVRRCPLAFSYTPVLCPHLHQPGGCASGVNCSYAHSMWEVWLHPQKYRTQMCTFGPACRRKVCFFAHTPEQLRSAASPAPPPPPPPPPPMATTVATSTVAMAMPALRPASDASGAAQLGLDMTALSNTPPWLRVELPTLGRTGSSAISPVGNISGNSDSGLNLGSDDCVKPCSGLATAPLAGGATAACNLQLAALLAEFIGTPSSCDAVLPAGAGAAGAAGRQVSTAGSLVQALDSPMRSPMAALAAAHLPAVLSPAAAGADPANAVSPEHAGLRPQTRPHMILSTEDGQLLSAPSTSPAGIAAAALSGLPARLATLDLIGAGHCSAISDCEAPPMLPLMHALPEATALDQVTAQLQALAAVLGGALDIGTARPPAPTTQQLDSMLQQAPTLTSMATPSEQLFCDASAPFQAAAAALCDGWATSGADDVTAVAAAAARSSLQALGLL